MLSQTKLQLIFSLLQIHADLVATNRTLTLDMLSHVSEQSLYTYYPLTTTGTNVNTCLFDLLQSHSISYHNCYDFLASSISSSPILFPTNLLDIQGLLPQNIKSIKNKEGVHGAISFCFRSKGTPMESLVKGLSKPFEVAEHNTTCSLNFFTTLKLMKF